MDKTKKIYLISTAPPSSCGIATFSQNLLESLQKVWCGDIKFERIPLFFSKERSLFSKYPLKIERQTRSDYVAIAKKLNNEENCAGVIIQHEFGIFGGDDGAYILDFLSNFQKSVFTTFHTVLTTPSDSQKLAISQIGKLSSSCSVMNKISRLHLIEKYQVDASKIEVIAHGIPYVPFTKPDIHRKALGLPLESKTALTFGLLSPGKGIEYGIRAVAENLKDNPDLQYLIVGATHPAVIEKEGEKYRQQLKNLIVSLEANNNIHFVNKFLEEKELLHWIQAADLYICPPQNPEQASSGTLSYALGCGRAVLATPFTHAKSVLNESTGALANFGDYHLMADKIKVLLKNNNHLHRLGENAYFKTRTWTWDNIALQLGNSIQKNFASKVSLIEQKPKVDLNTLAAQTDNNGIWQFSKLHENHTTEGYTLDDNARAAIVCHLVLQEYSNTPLSLQALDLLETYAEFIANSYQTPFTSLNYFNSDMDPVVERNTSENMDDSQARGIWALANLVENKKISSDIKEKIYNVWKKFISSGRFDEVEQSPRATAFVGMGLIDSGNNHKDQVRSRCMFLSDLLDKNSDNSWYWYEDKMTYANGVLPHFHIMAADYLNDAEQMKKALKTLDFLISQSYDKLNTTPQPIGQNGWLVKSEEKATYDQQPEEAAHISITCSIAYNITKDEQYKEYAHDFLSWFYGNNIQHLHVYNRASNSVYDGLTSHGLNLNEGAESLVMHLMALITYNKYCEKQQNHSGC